MDVGEVYRVDASRRTTAVNAYVGGLGHTKRVVLYDNLIEDFPAGPGAQRGGPRAGPREGTATCPKGLLWLAIVAPAGTFLVQRLAERIAGRWTRARGPTAGSLPALALALALVSFGLTCAGNALSRPVEARADAFALELTNDPEAFIELERSLALRNLGDPDPPGCSQALFGTHPTTMERIGLRRGSSER